MGLFHYLWSRNAASNASADPAVNFAEGQAPSTVNDSARAMMASAAAFRDDIAGAIVTGGTSTAYTVASYQVFDTLAHMSGQVLAFTPHATNGSTVTLNVDGLGAKPLRSAPSTELLAGTLVLGTPYVATYNNTDGAWYLQNFYGNPYNVPVAGGMDYWGATVPNSSFAFPAGQAINRTTYASLYALMGTTHGVGDGSTTFNLPDKTGRVSAMKEASASRLTASYFVGNSTTLGAVGGAEALTLSLSQLPTGISSPVTTTLGLSSVVTAPVGFSSYSANAGSQVWSATSAGNFVANNNPTATGTAVSNNTGGAAHRTVQPTIITNYIIRII